MLGYWDQILNTDPNELQAWIDGVASRTRCPCLVVFGRTATDGERQRVTQLPDAQIEEWVGDGHFVHLVDSRRFATRLLAFVEHCNRVN